MTSGTALPTAPAGHGPEHEVAHFVNGERLRMGVATFESVSPVTGRPWATVARGSAEDVSHAVDAAKRAFRSGLWAQLSVQERGNILRRFADLIDESAKELAELEAMDVGKPVKASREREIPRAAEYLRYYGDLIRFEQGSTFPTQPGYHLWTEFAPVGVIGAIAPWNYPLMLAMSKVAPALAYGNSVVLKPAEQSPASALRMAELGIEAGIPAGVLNVVQGYGPGEAGEALVANADVGAITFTGESSTGSAVMQVAAPTLKKVSLELGGKNANVVFADADVERSVMWSLNAAFGNSGQACLSGSRILLQRTLWDTWLERFVARADEMICGDPFDPVTELGPLVSEEHYAKVVGHLDRATSGGATLVTGGVSGSGWYVRPTVLTDVDADMPVCREEVFGPVVTVQPFDDEQQAIELANALPYGLTAAVFTADAGRARRVSTSMEAGMVWVNCFRVRDLGAPFGGWKRSGVGREGAGWSREFFTEARTVTMSDD